MKAVFFTAADPEIGLGHLFRCDALAQALTLSGVSTELIIDSTSGEGWIAQKPVNTMWRVCRWTRDTAQFSSRLAECDIPVFDAYEIDRSIWQLLQESRRRCVVFDDFGEKPELPGLLINGSPGAYYLTYRDLPDRSLLIGHQYQVLRPPFWNPPPESSITDVQRVGILMGGTDSHHYSEQIIRIVDIVFPPDVKVFQIGKKGSTGSGRVYGTGMLSSSEIRELFSRLDFLICGGGQTIPEAVACGVPALIFCLVKNQHWNYIGWGETGAVIPVGDLTNEKMPAFGSFHSELSKIMNHETREKCCQRAKELNLHTSTRRVASRILSLRGKKE